MNGKELDLKDEIYVEELLKIKRFTYPKIIVKINGVVIDKNDYNTTLVKNNDVVQVIHLLAGG